MISHFSITFSQSFPFIPAFSHHFPQFPSFSRYFPLFPVIEELARNHFPIWNSH